MTSHTQLPSTKLGYSVAFYKLRNLSSYKLQNIQRKLSIQKRKTYSSLNLTQPNEKTKNTNEIRKKKNMRILLADNLSEIAITRLEDMGFICVSMPELTADELPEHIAGYEVLVVRSTKVTSSTLEAGNILKLVVRAGSGTNTINCERATELGVLVCNVPGRNAIAVAELALGLILAVDRHIASSTADARSGVWNKKAYSRARGIYGSTLGIIGMGSIGLELAKRAAVCGMQLVAIDTPERAPHATTLINKIGGEYISDRNALLAASDVVSLHVPAVPETIGMVDSNFLATMKSDAVIINTSRGEIVNEQDLLAALNSTDMKAGLDVFLDEPKTGVGQFKSALVSHPKVTTTHHIGASTRQAQRAVAEGTVEVIKAYSEGSTLHCVNQP